MFRNQTKYFRPLASLARGSLMSVGTLLVASVISQPAQAESQGDWTVEPTSKTAAKHCEATGGKVLTWHFYAGSLGALEKFGTAMRTCQYQGDTANDGYITSITVELETLFSKRPTLAALAYYKRVPFDTTKVAKDMSPSVAYCQQLGGSAQQAVELDSRPMQWQTKPNEAFYGPMCVFPDRSVIDAWGLAYMQNDTVRGIDLGTVLLWKNPFLAAARR